MTSDGGGELDLRAIRDMRGRSMRGVCQYVDVDFCVDHKIFLHLIES